MNHHHYTLRAIAGFGTFVGTIASVIYGAATDFDLNAILATLGFSGGLLAIAWKVWSDATGRVAVENMLNQQIARLAAERDYWLQRAEKAEDEVKDLAVQLAAGTRRPVE